MTGMNSGIKSIGDTTHTNATMIATFALRGTSGCLRRRRIADGHAGRNPARSFAEPGGNRRANTIIAPRYTISSPAPIVTRRSIPPAVIDNDWRRCSTANLCRCAGVMVASRDVDPVVGPVECERCDSSSTPPLDALRGRLPERKAYVETAELFRLLGGPTRVAILHALLARGVVCMCDLAAAVGVGEKRCFAGHAAVAGV